jgi:hypothetical protein
MNVLSDMDVEELALLADQDFREQVQVEARTLSGEAFDTYRDVMSSSSDDQARVKAADRILSLAGIEEKQNILPSGVSEEVFKLALAGLGQLAGIAKLPNASTSILKNVTPAKNDPRLIPQLEMPKDDSPMNTKSIAIDDNDAILNVIAGERYEIYERKS